MVLLISAVDHYAFTIRFGNSSRICTAITWRNWSNSRKRGLEQGCCRKDDQTRQLCERSHAVISDCGMYVFKPIPPFTLSRMRSAGQMMRKTMRDFTFTDGTTIPAGNFVCVPTACINTDPVRISYHLLYWRLRCTNTQDFYADPGTFDGFRFEKIHDSEKEGGQHKHSLSSLDLDYLLFGSGRHAWYT